MPVPGLIKTGGESQRERERKRERERERERPTSRRIGE